MRGAILALAFLWGAAPLHAQNLAGVKAIVASGNTSFALLSDGTVWAWGYNEYGQLGDQTLTNRTAPVRVSGLTDAAAISGRLAVKLDGTVWQWGEHLDPSGGALVINKEPVQVSGLTEIVAVAGSYAYSLALRSDGTVWAWGLNTLGELGDGMPPSPSPPVGAPSTPPPSGEPFPSRTLPGRATAAQVGGLTDMVAIAAGLGHGLALRSDGTVWAWGLNALGDMGDGITPGPFTTLPGRVTPAQVSGVTDVVAVAAGYGHNLALKADGTVWAWGFNGHGQLGDGTTETRTTPVQVSGLAGVIKIAAGDAHSMAVNRDGTVWVWGSNAAGQLGDGTTADRLLPVQAALTRAAAVAGGQLHSLALKDDGTVWAWGRDEYGQLGGGTQLPQLSGLGPLQVGGVSGVREIAAGSTHSLALKDDGTVWAWGNNTAGQLGDGTRSPQSVPGRSTPAQVSDLPRVVAIAGASSYSLAVTADGGVWKWGLTDYEGGPPEAHAPPPLRVSGLAGAVAVATGTSYHLAVGGDGSLWEWGFNLDLIFGPPNLDPAPVSGLTEVEAAAAALGQNLALKRDGTVWEWGPGWGRSGRTPTRVSGLTDVVSVAAGCSVWWQSCHGLALKRDGTVWAWGDNDSGQLGDGTTTGRTTPLPIGGLSQVVAIAARNFADAHDVAVKSDGTVWEWPTAGQSTPVQVAGLSGIVAIAEGAAHTLALRRDGTVWAWGSNQSGQLGVETIVTRTTPVQVVAPAP
jgi:alpha-tubulin suppressor-like RCC1 family protein